MTVLSTSSTSQPRKYESSFVPEQEPAWRGPVLGHSWPTSLQPPLAAGGQRVTVMTPVPAPSAVCTPCTVSWSLPNCGRTSAVPVQASCEDSGMHLRLGTRGSSSCLPGNLPPSTPSALQTLSLDTHCSSRLP